MKKLIALSIITITFLNSCKKDTGPAATTPPPAARLRFVYKFDSTQVRLNNLGQVSTIPANHRAQSPKFNAMGAHYIEMATSDYTAVGGGTVLYVTPSVTTGITTGTYTNAIDFNQQPVKGQGEELYSVPLSQVKPGTYKWLRVSLAYQNYDIRYKYTYMSSPFYLTGTIASFIGYNTYINSYKIKTQTMAVNANKLQGYWGFETSYTINSVTTTTTSVGQAPAGSTTVVNPLFSSSPIPAGSCLVTGQFVNASGSPQLLTITGNETKDIVITVSLSTNNSFEWVEHTGDNWYEPAAGDTVVDMGVRGMIPFIQP
ncbi:MAG TPA: hypothetical protein VNZ49_10735 [Bacteroidia bacterium]|jgi:hypothetical protein|nr:hypothetical protein [Bacteroidia bacterium]